MRIPKKTALILGLVVLVAAAATWTLTRAPKAKPTANTAVPVTVVSVVQQDVPRYVSGIGSVLSLHSVVIRPQIDGILTKLLVKEGQLVKEGDLLATLDDRSIQASLAQAKAQLAQSQAEILCESVHVPSWG